MIFLDVHEVTQNKTSLCKNYLTTCPVLHSQLSFLLINDLNSFIVTHISPYTYHLDIYIIMY
jgi:hypothetical protein